MLDPYIDAYDYDLEDFGEGLIASTSYEDEQICLPYLISTQVMYYNKTAAEEEGITMPKTFDEMEAFLEKATIFQRGRHHQALRHRVRRLGLLVL